MDFTEDESFLWPYSPSSVTSDGEVIQQLNDNTISDESMFVRDEALVPIECVNITSSSIADENDERIVPKRKCKIQVYNDTTLKNYMFRIMLCRTDAAGLITEFKEHLNARDFTVLAESVVNEPGIIPHVLVDVEIKSGKGAEATLWDIVDLLFAVEGQFSIVFAEDSMFNQLNSHGLQINVNLEGLRFCSRTADSKFWEHWKINRNDGMLQLPMDICNSFDFQHGYVTTELRTWFDEAEVIHIRMNSIKKVWVSHLSRKDNKVCLVLELNSPVEITRKRVYPKSEIEIVTENETSNLYGGEDGTQRSRKIIKACRHICMDFTVKPNEFYLILAAFSNVLEVEIEFERMKFDDKLMLKNNDNNAFMSWSTYAPVEDNWYNELLDKVRQAREREALTKYLTALIEVNSELLLHENDYKDFCQRVVDYAVSHFDKCIELLTKIIEVLKNSNRCAALIDVFNDFKEMQADRM